MNIENMNPNKLWNDYLCYRENKFIEGVLAQKNLKKEEILQNNLDLENNILKKGLKIKPVLKNIEDKLNECRNWDEATHYIIGASLPEYQYAAMIRGELLDSFSIPESSIDGWQEYTYYLGIARINGHGRTVRMNDLDEITSVNNLGNMQFACIDIRSEQLAKNKKKVYVIYTGVDEDNMNVYAVTSNLKNAYTQSYVRLKELGRILMSKMNLNVDMTHPYKMNKPVRSLFD